MSALLPTWPHILFTIIEPITLIAGWTLPFVDLDSFIIDQVPQIAPPSSLHSSSIALAYQLSNLYGLLFLLGVAICNTTTELKVVRNYLVCLAIADAGHIYWVYKAMGWDTFMDVGGWNVLTWGNVGITGFLFLNRIAYFLGVFGGGEVAKRREGPKRD